MSESRHKIRRYLLGTLTGIALSCCLTQLGRSQSAADPKTIMTGVYRQDTSHDTSLRAVFDVFDKDGHKTQKRFVLLRLGSPGDSKTLVRFTDPPEIRGVALLSLNHAGQNDQQWIYTPATDRVRSVSPRERSDHFAGTDYTYEDVAERVLDDFSYRLLNEKDTIDGHPTFKIAATPIDATRSQYKFVYYWVGQDVPCILHAEMYDQSGREVRILHATQLKKVSGIWGARHTEIGSVAENTRTVLTIDEVRFNQSLDDTWFTPEGMKTQHDLKKPR